MRLFPIETSSLPLLDDPVELQIMLGDMRIQYRTIDELIKARDTIRADLAAQQSAQRSYPRYQTANFSDE